MRWFPYWLVVFALAAGACETGPDPSPAAQDEARANDPPADRESKPSAQQDPQETALRAKRLYEVAYVIKTSNPQASLANLDEVLKLLPEDHIYHLKARKLRARIQDGL